MNRGYFGIGVYKPKFEVNYGTLFRTANVYGAAFLFVIGARFRRQASDTMASHRHLPTFVYDTFEEFQNARPFDCPLVGIELTPTAVPLAQFDHPCRAVYLLGAEDHGLPPKILDQCQSVIVLPGDTSVNVSVAGSIVLYDRITKAERKAAI